MKKIDIANQLLEKIHTLENESSWADHIDIRTMHGVILCVENVIMSWATERKSHKEVRECFRPLEAYQRIKAKNNRLKEKINKKNEWKELDGIIGAPEACGRRVQLAIKHPSWRHTQVIHAFYGYGNGKWYTDDIEYVENIDRYKNVIRNELNHVYIPVAWKEIEKYEVID